MQVALATKDTGTRFDAAEDFGGRWEKDPSVANAARENNLELLQQVKNQQRLRYRQNLLMNW